MTATPPPLGTAWHTATFTGAFTRFWRSYTVFSGRAARAEFWWWSLWWGIATVAINIIYGISLFTMTFSTPSPAQSQQLDQALARFNPFPIWGYLLASLPLMGQIALGVFAVLLLAAALPWVALAMRRLHDTNRAGWWVLLYLVPGGNVALIVLLTLPSDGAGVRFDRHRPRQH